MKILLDFSLNKQDFEDLQEHFNNIESYELNKWEYDNVIVDTNELSYELFEDWLVNYVNIGFSVVYDRDKQNYILTDIS